MTISAGGIPFYVSYLMGEHSLKGWWYYYIIAFFVKNPETVFIILLLTVAVWIGNKKERPDRITTLCIWIPMISYFIYFSFFTHIPIGIRYILPVFPLFFLAAGYLLNESLLAQKSIKIILAIAALLYLFTAAAIFPQYLSYFNTVSGGSQNGLYFRSEKKIWQCLTTQWTCLKITTEMENIIWTKKNSPRPKLN
jgi:hypothetical protein